MLNLKENPTIIPEASIAVCDAAKKTVAIAQDRMTDETTDSNGNKRITLLDQDTGTLYQIMENSVARVIYIDSITPSTKGERPKMSPTLVLPNGDITPKNIRYLGVREQSNPNLADEIVTLATNIAGAVPTTSELFNKAKIAVFSGHLVRPDYRAPLRSAARILWTNNVARVNRLLK